MAIIPNEQKFHTLSKDVVTENLGSADANSQRRIYTMEDICETVTECQGGPPPPPTPPVFTEAKITLRQRLAGQEAVIIVQENNTSLSFPQFATVGAGNALGQYTISFASMPDANRIAIYVNPQGENPNNFFMASAYANDGNDEIIVGLMKVQNNGVGNDATIVPVEIVDALNDRIHLIIQILPEV